MPEARVLLAGAMLLLLVTASMPAMPHRGGDAPGPASVDTRPARYEAIRDLVARRTAVPVVIDGVPDAIWAGAMVLDGYVTGPSDNLHVDLRAMFDDGSLYILATWEETGRIGAAPNYDREPWVLTSNATPGAWARKYWGEDRLSFMWEPPTASVQDFSSQGCNGVCHHEEEMHTLNPGEFLDTWEWSASTTDVNGYADDGFLTNNNSFEFDPLRMHVTKSDIDWDPGDDGWWVNLDVGGGGGRPAHIWRGGITPSNRSFLMESEASQVDWSSFDVTTLPTGYWVPGHLIRSPSGDRADVAAKGIFDGRNWTVELARARSTGSPTDVDFSATNLAYNFSIAVTNNLTGENHSEVPDILRLWLAEPDMPDLRPTSIALVHEPYVVGLPARVNVFVDNIGWADSGASSMALFWDGQATPVGHAAVGPVPWGGYKAVLDVAWGTTGMAPGVHVMRVVVDANGTVDEIAEDNNALAREVMLHAELLPDLTVASVAVDPPEAHRDGRAMVSVTVRNTGTLAAAAVVVALSAEATGEPLGGGTADLPAGGTVAVPIAWTVSLAEGRHWLNATVDPGQAFREADEGNNTLLFEVLVLPPAVPDLVVVALELASPGLAQGDAALANVTVRNEGTADAPAGLGVALYLDVPVTQGTAGQVGSARSTGAIAPQGAWVAQVTWAVPLDAAVGAHTLRAHVNWDRALAELDGTDNNATLEGVTVQPRRLPDLVVSRVDPAGLVAKLGMRFELSVVVANLGTAASQPCTLRAANAATGASMGSAPVPGVAAAGAATVQFAWTVAGVPPGPLAVALTVDGDLIIEESDELNNVLEAALTVLGPDVPDLAVLRLSFSPAEPRIGESVAISVLVANNGTAPSALVLLEVTAGGERVDQRTLDVLEAGAQVTVAVFWSASGVLAPGPFDVHVEVDPAHVGGEAELGNNLMWATVTFRAAPAPSLGNLTVGASAQRVAEGAQVVLTVGIWNAGDAADTVRLVVTDGTEEVASWQSMVIPAGGGRTEDLAVSLAGEGEHVLTVAVYRGTTVVLDALGGAMVASVVVVVEAPGDDGGVGTTVLVAVAIAAAVVLVLAVLMVRRRRGGPGPGG